MLISTAYAQTASAQTAGGGFEQILMMVVMFVVLYFIIIRPQMKRAKEHKVLLEALAKGDEIVTQGGIAGRISKLGDNFVTVEIADKIEVQVQKSSIQLVLPKGSLKSL